MNKTIFLDAGHGGMKDGVYTTSPSKMWKHNRGIFHNGSTFYEGVSNRLFADLFYNQAINLGYNVIKVYHPFEDTSLQNRVDIANSYHSKITNGIFISLHSNAVGKQDSASGLSIWTTIGKTNSDLIAQKFIDIFKEELPNIKVMEDLKDKDSDYESDFKVLKDTIMPAILIENLFFDNFNDASLLMNKEYQIAFTNCLIKTIQSI